MSSRYSSLRVVGLASLLRHMNDIPCAVVRLFENDYSTPPFRSPRTTRGRGHVQSSYHYITRSLSSDDRGYFCWSEHGRRWLQIDKVLTATNNRLPNQGRHGEEGLGLLIDFSSHVHTVYSRSTSHGLLSVYSRPTLTDLISRLKDVRNEVRKLDSGRTHYVPVHLFGLESSQPIPV